MSANRVSKLSVEERKRRFAKWFIETHGQGDLEQIADALGITRNTAQDYLEEMRRNWHDELIKSPSIQERTEKWFGRAIAEYGHLIELAFEDLNELPRFETTDEGVDPELESKRIQLLRTIADLYRQRNEIIGLTGTSLSEQEIRKRIEQIKAKAMRLLETQRKKGLSQEEYERKKKIIIGESHDES